MIIDEIKKRYLKGDVGQWIEFEKMDDSEVFRLLNYMYTKGYQRGHDDTVDSNFTDVHHTDYEDYFSFYVNEILFE